MRNLVTLVLTCVTLSAATSCKKKEAGICYCKYVSGDEKQFDLKALNDDAARDSCNILNRNANAFGGDCDIK